MDLSALARAIIVLAVGLLVVGVLILIVSRFTGGRGLPGDIFFRRDGTTIYFPIVTSILISILLSLIVSFLLWLFNRGR